MMHQYHQPMTFSVHYAPYTLPDGMLKTHMACSETGSDVHVLCSCAHENTSVRALICNADGCMDAKVDPFQGDNDTAPAAEVPTPSAADGEAVQAAAPPRTPEKNHPASSGRGMIAQGLLMLKEVSSPEPAPKAPVRVRPLHC